MNSFFGEKNSFFGDGLCLEEIGEDYKMNSFFGEKYSFFGDGLCLEEIGEDYKMDSFGEKYSFFGEEFSFWENQLRSFCDLNLFVMEMKKIWEGCLN